MKTNIFFILMIFLNTLFAQRENINCIVMVDGKLTANDLQGYIEYTDRMQQLRKIEIDCHTPGIFGVNTENMVILRSLPDTIEVKVHFYFTEFKKGIKQTIHHYNHSFIIGDLFNSNYVIFSITNLNKRKGTYYFDYAIDNMRKTWRKEWGKGYKKKNQIFYNEY